MRYPYILVDIGETLVGPAESYGAVYARVLSELGLALPADRMEASIRQVAAGLAQEIPPGTDRFSHFDDGEHGFWRRFCSQSIERASGEAPDADFVDRSLALLRNAFAVSSAWRVYPEVIPALGELRHSGVALGVVSNWDSRLPRILEAVGLAGFFDVIGVSALEGMEKPDPRFFLRVLERLGGRPELALHVGNVPELDSAGARAAGIDALLVDRAGVLSPGHGPVSDLTGLPAVARDGLAGD